MRQTIEGCRELARVYRRSAVRACKRRGVDIAVMPPSACVLYAERCEIAADALDRMADKMFTTYNNAVA